MPDNPAGAGEPAAARVLADLAGHVDISCVKAQHRRSDLEALAQIATSRGFVAAHVLPTWVPLMRELIGDAATLTGAPAGFPSGGSTTAVKVAEVAGLLEQGAQEIDVVAAIGRIRSGEFDYVARELSAVVDVVRDQVPLRVILEVGYLDDEQLRGAVDAAIDAGVSWIKTGTGWSGIPTTVRHIEIIVGQARGRARLKAAGGIRDLATIRRMAELGVTRFGMNADAATAAVADARGGRG